MQSSNDALNQEKQRMDVLLARQYNLIGCVLQQEGEGGGKGHHQSVENKTLGTIMGSEERLSTLSSIMHRHTTIYELQNVPLGADSKGLKACAEAQRLCCPPTAVCQRAICRTMSCLGQFVWLTLVGVSGVTAAAKIEDLRREIGVTSGTTGVDELQLIELMDEGTYGKVFRGWSIFGEFCSQPCVDSVTN